MQGTVDFILGHSRRMNAISRFNTRIRTYTESVSAHSFYVAMYSFLITTIINKEGGKLDVNIAIKKALFHDIEESIAGDILTPFKKKFSKEYMSLCNLAFDEVTRGLDSDIKETIKDLWSTAKDGDEGMIVEFCDDLAGMVYCLEQLNTGNKFFPDIADDYLSRLKKATKYPILIKITEEIERRYDEIIS